MKGQRRPREAESPGRGGEKHRLPNGSAERDRERSVEMRIPRYLAHPHYNPPWPRGQRSRREEGERSGYVTTGLSPSPRNSSERDHSVIVFLMAAVASQTRKRKAVLGSRWAPMTHGLGHRTARRQEGRCSPKQPATVGPGRSAARQYRVVSCECDQ